MKQLFNPLYGIILFVLAMVLMVIQPPVYDGQWTNWTYLTFIVSIVAIVQILVSLIKNVKK